MRDVITVMRRGPIDTVTDIPLAGGPMVRVKIRTNKRAKHLILRFDERDRMFRCTLPVGVDERQAQQFIEARADWMAACLMRNPSAVIRDGGTVPLHGRRHRLVYDRAVGRTVQVEGCCIRIGGDPDLAPGRLGRFIEAEGRRILTPMVRKMADRLNVEVATVRFGDMRSRWGSCSSTGVIKLSWRLVMAPAEIQNYVAAHEVAHRLEMNHSPHFWGHVARLDPAWQTHRRWLRREGAGLQAIAFSAPTPAPGRDQHRQAADAPGPRHVR